MQYKLRLRLIDSINLIRFVLFLFRLQLFEIRLWFLSTSLYVYILKRTLNRKKSNSSEQLTNYRKNETKKYQICYFKLYVVVILLIQESSNLRFLVFFQFQPINQSINQSIIEQHRIENVCTFITVVVSIFFIASIKLVKDTLFVCLNKDFNFFYI